MTEEELRAAQLKEQYQQQGTGGASLAQASPQGENGASFAYTPSSAVSQAQSYLAGLKKGQAQEFTSPYTEQIAALYDKIMNRQKFSYDSTKDPLFQAYKNQYVRQGQQAAQNVIGQSAALTGGYGNTWAATAGSQAYQDYLTRLNELLPEMEARAYERYTGEGEQLQNQLSVASALENQEYERFRNALADWQAQQKSGGGGKKKDDKKTGIFSTIANNVKDFVDKYNRQQQETAAQNETAQNNASIWAGYRPDESESQQEEMAALYNQLNSNNQSRTDNPIERAKNNLGRKKQTQQQQTKDFLKEY